ncbi:MAG: hypothetical protein Greene041662_559 [Candidatus Peregrinibacteria bacterium Greene0416_62]|nr:MAG: hypothetical protein Greene041662_559 [Candidatus Peregrinibacteria bacterium Greene0416_62]TSC98588.1 MAG: hypothetical protein Greene101449_924 [Candidatus Peregrinibacteria bacterium Greene1014_49]
MVQLIAELCQNHCGDRKLLGEMIAAAAENGADIVKSQIIFSEDLTHRREFDEGEVLSDGTRIAIKRPYAAEYERLKALDLTEDDHRFFIDECKRCNVLPMTTVFSRNRIPFAASLPWPKRIVKVASYDCASYQMLKELSENFDHLYISTGATFDEEVAKTAELMRACGKIFSLLHCVTSYPNTMEMCNLRRMQWLKQFTPSVGWSDHTLVKRDGLKASKAAIALGADVIERHFTILPEDQTKDGPVSITPTMLKELHDFATLDTATQTKEIRKEIPDWKTVLGTETRPLTPTELLNRDYYRGRFASKVEGKWVYNWETKSV